MRILMSLLIAVFLMGGQAVAKTPDGETPAEEDVCAAEEGAAYGLCNAYCEAMDCDSDEAHASKMACDKVYNKFQQVTGSAPPCLGAISVCPAWSSAELEAFYSYSYDHVIDNHDICNAAGCMLEDAGDDDDAIRVSRISVAVYEDEEEYLTFRYSATFVDEGDETHPIFHHANDITEDQYISCHQDILDNALSLSN